VLCNTAWIINKLTHRSFHETLHDFELVSGKDADVREIESILVECRLLPDNPHLFQLDLLARFSRAPAANSPAIGRMVAEAAMMVLVTAERCIVPLYPCVSPTPAAHAAPAASASASAPGGRLVAVR